MNGQSIHPHFSASGRFIALPALDSVPVATKVPFTLRKDSYVTNLAFFCRQEWKVEKTLKVPVRFRVGSLEQCNRLEGKTY